MLIAVVPAFVYAFAFAFEAAYASHFNIPFDLIQVDLNLVLTVFASVLIVAIFAGVLSQYLPTRKTWIVLHRFIVPSFIAVITVAVLAGGFGWWSLIPLMLLLLTLWGAVFYPLWVKREGSIWDRWEVADREELERETRGIHKSVFGVAFTALADMGLNRRWFVRVYWILFVGILFFASGGTYKAWTQREFYIRPGDPPVALLRRWGDYYVGAVLDTSRRALTEELVIFSMSDLSGAVLERRSLREALREAQPEKAGPEPEEPDTTEG